MRLFSIPSKKGTNTLTWNELSMYILVGALILLLLFGILPKLRGIFS